MSYNNTNQTEKKTNEFDWCQLYVSDHSGVGVVYHMYCYGSEKSLAECQTTRLYYEPNCGYRVSVNCRNKSKDQWTEPYI